jgi:hypothetical protein
MPAQTGRAVPVLGVAGDRAQARHGDSAISPRAGGPPSAWGAQARARDRTEDRAGKRAPADHHRTMRANEGRFGGSPGNRGREHCASTKSAGRPASCWVGPRQPQRTPRPSSRHSPASTDAVEPVSGRWCRRANRARSRTAGDRFAQFGVSKNSTLTASSAQVGVGRLRRRRPVTTPTRPPRSRRRYPRITSSSSQHGAVGKMSANSRCRCREAMADAPCQPARDPAVAVVNEGCAKSPASPSPDNRRR